MTSVPRIVFFGSFLEYSAVILEKLVASDLIEVVGVVTTPPQVLGKEKILTPTPVQALAEKLGLPVFTPEKLDANSLAELIEEFQPIDYFVTAGYGKLLPPTWLSAPSIASLNLHFSLLPSYRGANPAEWALLFDAKDTGVTLIEMSPEFDTGTMVAQVMASIEINDTRETIYEKLYSLGGDVLPEMISGYHAFRTTGEMLTATQSPDITFFVPPQPQSDSPTPYAKRLQREDGFIPWSAVSSAMKGESFGADGFSSVMTGILKQLPQPLTAHVIERAARALAGFPSLWTIIPTAKGDKRMKMLACHVEGNKLVLDHVQIEGKAAARWNEVKNILN